MARIGEKLAPVQFMLLQLAIFIFSVTVLLSTVKPDPLLKNTSLPGPGIQVPAIPPLLRDQCVGSFHSPDPPIQNISAPKAGGKFHPGLFPASTLLIAFAENPGATVALISWSTT